MKSRNLFLTMCTIFALGASVVLSSCGEEEPEKEKEVTFASDPDKFCSENPFDTQCCIPDYDLDCYCTTGTNGTDDTEHCCLFAYNPTCFCEKNPDDAQCEQDFGVGNGLGLIIDFEAGLESFDADFYNPSGKATFDGDENIEAIEGDHYLSLVLRGDEGRGWHDFKYWPEGGVNMSDMSNPTVNFWVNSGPNEADSLGFTLAFHGKEGDGTDYAAHPLFKASTGGKWVLMSFPVSEMTVQNGWDGGSHSVDMDATYSGIKFAFNPETWHIAGDFVCHVDAISITDGPLEQLPWVE